MENRDNTQTHIANSNVYNTVNKAEKGALSEVLGDSKSRRTMWITIGVVILATTGITVGVIVYEMNKVANFGQPAQ